MLPFVLLDTARYPLALAPSDRTGWFSGTSLIAVDPVSRETDVSVAHAAAALERTFAAEEFGVTAALLRYDGTAEVRTYTGALSHSAAGWSRHGEAPSIPDASPSRADRIAMERTSRRAVLGRSSVDLDEHEWVRAVESVQELILKSMS